MDCSYIYFPTSAYTIIGSLIGSGILGPSINNNVSITDFNKLYFMSFTQRSITVDFLVKV